MRRVAILYNPRSGMGRSRRRADVERAAAVFRVQGIEVELQPTAGPHCADSQARQFIQSGFDTIVACGGDGTVHDVLQGLAGSDATLGVIPLGTANSLAADLGLATDPAKAAAQLLTAKPTRLAIGKIEYQHKPEQRERRYFTVAAGVGIDAALFYKLNARFKQRYGMAAYVGESLRQWLIQKFHPFQVEWFDTERQQQRKEVVTQLLVVRIANFGGVLNQLAPGADLLRDDFRLVLFKTASRARYLRFATGRLIGQDWTDPHIELVHATSVSC
ncbi:MAG TPA: diacylglycerol kinase family protein, partial [Terriglobales bacterium]|nr:diacylglycerol kinase family protein [Terriglobales bacterium]